MSLSSVHYSIFGCFDSSIEYGHNWKIKNKKRKKINYKKNKKVKKIKNKTLNEIS
jgi:hypothetical protein